MSYKFNDLALATNFLAFDDSVATAYGVPGLCALTYNLSLASDATNYGVTVNSATKQISVLTTNSGLIGTSISLTLSANSSVVQQATASQTVTFTVSVVDLCLNTIISLPFATLSNMISTITQAAATQTFGLATDS